MNPSAVIAGARSARIRAPAKLTDADGDATFDEAAAAEARRIAALASSTQLVHRAREIHAKRVAAAMVVQRLYRNHIVLTYMKEQAALTERLERKNAAIVIQRAIRPKVKVQLQQRAEAQQFTRELMTMLDKQKDEQARAAFAKRLDVTAALRVADVANLEEDSELVSFLNEIKAGER